MCSGSDPKHFFGWAQTSIWQEHNGNFVTAFDVLPGFAGFRYYIASLVQRNYRGGGTDRLQTYTRTTSLNASTAPASTGIPSRAGSESNFQTAWLAAS